tara:strand:+ start:1345 stop:2226 length:882 start_codon:yes stop_codon:yes gene_type:complete
VEKLIIKQGAGIGDILFSLKLARILHEQYECGIIWPLHTSLLKDFKSYIQIPYIKWVEESDYKWLNDYQMFNNPKSDSWSVRHTVKVDNKTSIFPLCEAAQDPQGKYTGGSIMCKKYDTFNYSLKNWQDDIIITRNREKEDELFYNVLGLTDGEEYMYVNKKYNSIPGSRPIDSTFMLDGLINATGKVVYGDVINGFSVFDWIKVFENAKDIHVVSTSLFYILEAMHKDLPPVTIYNRDHSTNLNQLNCIIPSLKKEWIFCRAIPVSRSRDGDKIKCDIQKDHYKVCDMSNYN